MKINNAEVWHTYSSFYNYGFSSIDELSQIFIATGFAKICLATDGSGFWKDVGTIHKSTISYEIYGKGNLAKVSISNMPKEEYLRTSLSWLINLEYNEKRLFHSDEYYKQKCIRMVLSEFALTINRDRYLFYPIISLFENGIVLCNFRFINDKDIELNDFIHNYVSTNQIDFQKLYTNPEICRLYNKHNKKTIIGEIEKEDDGDFVFDLEEIANDNNIIHLRDVSDIIFYLISDQLNMLCKGKEKIRIGTRWNGHTQIHLFKYVGQMEDALVSNEKNKEAFTKMVLQIENDIMKYETIPLEDLRMFNDFNAYYTESCSLYVWSKKGIENNKEFSESTNMQLIFNNQVIANYIEYLVITYHKILDQINISPRIDYTYDLQEYYYYLNNLILESGHFGELNNLVKYACNVRNIKSTANQIENKIAMNRERMINKQEKKQNSYSNILVVVFGLISIPTFANEVIKPLFKILQINFGFEKDLTKLIYIAISGILVGIVIWLMKPKNK
jgi:hypothetical protein